LRLRRQAASQSVERNKRLAIQLQQMQREVQARRSKIEATEAELTEEERLELLRGIETSSDDARTIRTEL